jgi:hypothetical protein
MDWKVLLAYITGSVDQAWLLRNEYLVTENRIMRTQIKGHVQLTNGERKTLAVIGKQLGQQAKDNVVLIPASGQAQGTKRGSPIHCWQRLGGLLKYYDYEAA